jgi:hypothetical protein
MIRRLLLLFILFGSVWLRAADEPEEEFTLLDLEKQPAEALPYFLRHAPTEAIEEPKTPAKFEPLPKGITAHLSEVGYVAGRRLFAVRYLADSRLVHGNDGAVGLVLLCSVQRDLSAPPRFAPIIVEWSEDEGGVEDYSVSPARQFGGFSFVWVRRTYSGTAATVDRTAITAPDATSPLRAYSLFADTDPLAELKKQGWKLWHRGNHFDEETLTWYYHLHRESAKDAEKDEYPHRAVRVRHKFRDGKLHPEKPEDVDDHD